MTSLNILNMLDRNLLSAFSNYIVPDLGLSNTEYGLLTKPCQLGARYSFRDRCTLRVSLWNRRTEKTLVEDSDLTKAVADEASKYPGQEKQVVEFYKQNPNLMQNLRGVAMEEKVMLYVVNSCKKKDKECTIDELFKSDFLKEENELIKQNKGDK